MKRRITRATPIEQTARVQQVSGIFDVPPDRRQEQSWQIELALPPKWNIGLVVGPSGSGKSTLLTECFHSPASWEWPKRQAVVDGFPAGLPVAEITGALSAVGFSSPPAWLRPYHTLSNGEQFRVGIARSLLEGGDPIVVDEFTSVVDRTVAQVGSAAVAKFVRRADRQLVAASCHYDIIEWLQPDWIYDCGTGRFSGRGLQRRPDIQLEVYRATRESWRLFRRHHYLSAGLSVAAHCWVALVAGQPAAFTSAIHFVHPRVKNMYRAHRTVVLPDYQGVGLGLELALLIARCFKAQGYRYASVSSHPAVVKHHARSPLWRMTRKPGSVAHPGGEVPTSAGRWTASFEYVGPPAPAAQVSALFGGLTLMGQPPRMPARSKFKLSPKLRAALRR